MGQGPADRQDGQDALVATPAGLLRGARRAGVGSWKGIPYAAPPVGPLRFRAPAPSLPWAGIRDATRFGASAPQPDSLPERVLGLDGHQPAAEDCLTLNVWSRGPGGSPRPVMVWVHGGSFLTGAGTDPLYDGTGFAARGDVVVVTLNYRLGPLGFLHLAGEADDNPGLRDVIAALEWVREGIAAFGGDPGCVTLFGQSAGAMAIGALMGAPAAKGLFHRAILQSGAARHVHAPAGAARVARALARALGLRQADPAALRAVPVERLVAASRAVSDRASLLGLPFQPMQGGALLPQPPLAAVRAGAAAGVPLLIGTTRDELGLYEVIAAQDPTPPAVKRWRRLRALAELSYAFGPARLLRIRRAYPPGPAGLLDMAGDAVFGMPALELAQAQAPHAPVFTYRFDWPSPAYEGRLGACHALDIPFVWHTLHEPAARLLTRDDAAERALAATMQAAWLAFARNGRPAAPALPPWPPQEEKGEAMILGAACRLDRVPALSRQPAWTADR